MNNNLEERLRTLRPAAPSAQLDRRVAATIQAVAQRRPLWRWPVPLWACGTSLCIVSGSRTADRTTTKNHRPESDLHRAADRVVPATVLRHTRTGCPAVLCPAGHSDRRNQSPTEGDHLDERVIACRRRVGR